MSYTYAHIEKVFEKMVSVNLELAELFFQERDHIPYIDVAIISRFIVNQKRDNNTDWFPDFFDTVEEIYIQGDDEVKNFIVIGLFEGIQNIGGKEIDYYSSFDHWLKPCSLLAWKNLIDSWEGVNWRIKRK